MDLLPTFHDLGGGDLSDILEIDGQSLTPALLSAALSDRVIAGEFSAEGVFEPAFMPRDRDHKLLYSEIDPSLNRAEDYTSLTTIVDWP